MGIENYLISNNIALVDTNCFSKISHKFTLMIIRIFLISYTWNLKKYNMNWALV